MLQDSSINILGIDRGKKYIGLAQYNSITNIIMPIGYLDNDGSIFYNIGDILVRNNINKIVVGYPKKQEDIKMLINKFINGLEKIISENIAISKIGEDYTSVEAGEVISNYQKHSAKDTVAAMKILERRIKKNIS